MANRTQIKSDTQFFNLRHLLHQRLTAVADTHYEKANFNRSRRIADPDRRDNFAALVERIGVAVCSAGGVCYGCRFV